MRSEADVVQACIDVYADRTDRAETLVGRSLDRARTYRPWIVAVAANIQIVLRHPLHAVPRRAGAPAVDAPVPRPDDRAVRRRLRALLRGIAALAQLDLAAAEEHLNGAVALARDSAGRRSHAAQLAGALLGELHYERGELDEAERLLEESRELGAESGVVDFMVASYALLARIKAHRGAAPTRRSCSPRAPRSPSGSA